MYFAFAGRALFPIRTCCHEIKSYTLLLPVEKL